MASQVGVRLQVERRKGVIVSALCLGQGVNPFRAVDGKPSVQGGRSKDLRLSKVGQKAMPISLLIEGEGVSETRFLSVGSLSRDTYNPHPT